MNRVAYFWGHHKLTISSRDDFEKHTKKMYKKENNKDIQTIDY